MRKAFLISLAHFMKKNEKLVVLTADMGFSVFEQLQEEFPNRFYNTGVTEQSSISIAAGLALSGYKVLFYAQAPFATMRCFEQIRLDIAYNNLDVTIVGASSGFYSNHLGVSHFALEDVALMRLLPNMTIFTPGDPYEAKKVTEAAFEIKNPTYIRLTKAGTPVVHTKPFSFAIGKGIKLLNGEKGTLFASGSLLPMAHEIAKSLHKKDIRISLFSLPTIKPLDKDLILKEAKMNKNIITLEDHYVNGGLGTAVAEVLADSKIKANLLRLGIEDIFTSVTGSVDYLLATQGLTPEVIIKKIIGFLK